MVDKNGIFIDCINNDYRPPYAALVEYHIIEKQFLFQIQFQYKIQQYKYFITSKSNILSIIQQFIDDNHLKSLSPDICLYFFDEYGKCIEDEIIDKSYNAGNKIISISVTEETINSNILWGHLEIMLLRLNNPVRTRSVSEISWKQYSSDRIHSVPPRTDRNLPKPAAGYGHRTPGIFRRVSAGNSRNTASGIIDLGIIFLAPPTDHDPHCKPGVKYFRDSSSPM